MRQRSGFNICAGLGADNLEGSSRKAAVLLIQYDTAWFVKRGCFLLQGNGVYFQYDSEM